MREFPLSTGVFKHPTGVRKHQVATEEPPTETLIWRSRVRQILQNDNSNVNSLLILFEKKLHRLLKQKSKLLGGFHEVIAIRHDFKYCVYGGRLNFGGVFSKKNK